MSQEDHAARPPAPATMTTAELLQAQEALTRHAFGFHGHVALHSAIKLGIPNAISSLGGSASLSELHALLPVAPSKRPCLSRLMRFLAASGIFAEDDDDDAAAEAAGGGARYHLTAISRLLVDDGGGGAHACQSPTIAFAMLQVKFMASLCLPDWLKDEDAAGAPATPFTMAYGTDFWGAVGRDDGFAAAFYEAMRCDSRFVAQIAVRECGEAFAGVRSLLDVGGGDGTMAKAIAEAFPHVRCSVLELPHVVDRMMPVDGPVQFIAGDMMDFIPPADVVLLKLVLHDWSDEDCVKILKRSKEAISTQEPKGKLIIIDAVVCSASKQTFQTQLLMDLLMMVITGGKERGEDDWSKIFMDAGFSHYKISPIFGTRSLIEVYP
ncbi:hypothetical protein ACP4OV_003540 [Aristida adscensionis]